MSDFIFNGLSQSTFICEETLSSEQLRLSLTLQSFCKEISSFSAILGFATVQPLACFVSSSSFRFFSIFARSSQSKIPLYHYLSSGLGYLAEGVCFPIVTDFASTGAFRIGNAEATLQGVGTILICKAIAKKIPVGNLILQHGAQSCALVSFDYGMEYVGLKEKENAGLVERLCFSELVAFRMSASAELLGVACPEYSRMRARQQLNYELNLPRKDSFIFRSKKYFFQEGGWEPKLVSANGAESPSLREYSDHSSLPWNKKGWGIVAMARDFSERAKRTAFIKAVQKQREVESVSQQVLEHPHLVEFRRYKDVTQKIVVESWKAFHESGQPANVAYYKDFAKKFLESHSFIEGIQNLEAKAAKIKELVNIGALCFDARHSFLDLPAPTMPIEIESGSESIIASRSPDPERELVQPSSPDSEIVHSVRLPKRDRPPVELSSYTPAPIPPPRSFSVLGALRKVQFAPPRDFDAKKVPLNRGDEIRKKWNSLEKGSAQIALPDIPEIIHHARQTGLSFEEIRSRLQRVGIPTDSFVYFLSESMRGLRKVDLQEASRVSPSSLMNLFSGRQETLQPKVLLRVVEALKAINRDLPTDFGANLFRIPYPEIGIFAPEARENSFIFLDPQKIPRIFQQDLRVALYARRMDEGLTRTEAGKILGVSDVTIRMYERLVVSDISEEINLKIGQFLQRDPLENYISNRSVVLRIFELVNPKTGEVYPMTEEFYRSLISEREGRQDPSNLRDELHQRMKEIDLHSLEELERHMIDKIKEFSEGNIDIASLVRKLSKVGNTIDLEEILFLKCCFPDLSVKKWYEHFNYAKLVYFLGRKADQLINYDFPEGIRHWDQINSDYILAEINRRLDEAKSDERKRMRDSIPEKYKKSIAARTITDEAVMRISRALNIDRRLLFFYLEKETLRKSLELG